MWARKVLFEAQADVIASTWENSDLGEYYTND